MPLANRIGYLGPEPHYLLMHINCFNREITLARSLGTEMRHLSLHEETLNLGEAWLNRLGLDREQPFVTVHVRDTSYVAEEFRREAGDPRSASLANFEPAITALLNEGLAVFRIGDRAGPTLGINHPRLFDVPWLGDHEKVARIRLTMNASNLSVRLTRHD